MGSVLQNLGGIADFVSSPRILLVSRDETTNNAAQFWQHDQKEAANKIGQLSVEIARTVSSAYAGVIDRKPHLAHPDDELVSLSRGFSRDGH